MPTINGKLTCLNFDAFYREWHGWIEGSQGKIHLMAINRNAIDLSIVPDGSELSIQVNYPPERKADTDVFRVVDFQVQNLNEAKKEGLEMGLMNGKSQNVRKQASVKRSPVKPAKSIPPKKKPQAQSQVKAPGKEQTYNKIELVGITGRDVECEFTNNGSQVLKCSMAVYMGKNKPNYWIDFQIWGDNLSEESIESILDIGKGSKIKLFGRLCGDVWQDKNTHAKRTRFYIVADDIEEAGEIKPSVYSQEEDEEEEEELSDDEEEEEEEEEEEQPKARHKKRF